MKIGRLAPWYRWIEYAAYGRALERRRFAFLPRLAAARRVLILGEGDGRALVELIRIAPHARFDVIEISPEMIGLAKRRAGECDRVRFHCADARNAAQSLPPCDAIVTNFFLDCFSADDARELIAQLSRALTPDGLWLIAEFAIPPRGWRRVHARLWISTMYRFFRLTTALRASQLPPIERFMRESGMTLTERQSARAGLMISEIWTHAATPRANQPSSAAPGTSL